MGGKPTMPAKQLNGQNIILTGANSGIGRYTGLELVRRGGFVVAACRNAKKGAAYVTWVQGRVDDTLKDNIVFQELDLSSQESVRAFADNVTPLLDQRGGGLHMLINNAGIMATPFDKTSEGFELQFGTNHLGHFLLTRLLMPKIMAADKAKIINLSSQAHRGAKGYDFAALENPGDSGDNYKSFAAYSVSKLANIHFTTSLAARLDSSKVRVYAVHPGVVNTNLFAHWRGMSVLKPLAGLVLKTEEDGARTSLRCALGDESDPSGQYWRDEAVSTPTAAAQDRKLAEELWRRSEQWTDVEAWDLPE